MILKPTSTHPLASDGAEPCVSSVEGWSNPIVTKPPATPLRVECPSTSADGTQSVLVCKGLAAPLAMHGFLFLSATVLIAVDGVVMAMGAFPVAVGVNGEVSTPSGASP